MAETLDDNASMTGASIDLGPYNRNLLNLTSLYHKECRNDSSILQNMSAQFESDIILNNTAQSKLKMVTNANNPYLKALSNVDYSLSEASSDSEQEDKICLRNSRSLLFQNGSNFNDSYMVP